MQKRDIKDLLIGIILVVVGILIMNMLNISQQKSIIK